MTTDLFNSLRRLSETADAFAVGVRAKVERYAGWFFGGRGGPIVGADQSGRFKDLLANASLFDQDLLTRTPANPQWRCEVVRGWPSRLWHHRIHVAAVVAVDLAEVIRRAGGQAGAVAAWPALAADALDEALKDYRSPPPRTFVGVCSPSGFTPETMELARRRAAVLSARGGGLVLVGPGREGGWVLRSPISSPPDAFAGGADENALAEPWHFLFDPEPVDDKIQRVRSAIEAGAADLAEAGLNDRRLAARLDVPRELVRQIFADESARRADVRVRQLDGDFVLLGAAGSGSRETNMSMFQRLRELLGLSGQEQRKIEMLGDKRALLASRREKLYRELDGLGEREQWLLSRGIAAESAVMQRRLAGELAEVRRRIEQGTTLAGLFNRQIDALSTHIHHLTLLTQGQAVAMPSVEDMTRDAVRAEELIERAKGDSEVVESLAKATGSTLSSKQEDQILAEFAAGKAGQGQAGGQSNPPARESGTTERSLGKPPSEKRREPPMKE